MPHASSPPLHRRPWPYRLLWLLLLSGNLAASPLNEGLVAFKQGDYPRAHTLWLPLAKGGDDKAQYNLGLLYENGWGVERHLTTAITLYKAAAAQGNADAQYNLGMIYTKGASVFRNRAEAARWWRQAAAQKHPEAMFNLGLLQLYGQGVKRDTLQALALWEEAAQLGNARARQALVRVYRSGEQGIPRDPQRAQFWERSRN